MARITDYASLQDNVITWLNRKGDTGLAADVPTMIQLFEAKARRRWKGVTPLTDTVGETTNWLLEAHPDVYLYGTLFESAPYLVDDERVPMWGELAKAASDNVRRVDTTANLTTYAGLQASVAEWLADARLDDRIPTFIQMAEAALRRDTRVRKHTCRGTFTITSDGDALPNDYGELVSWEHDGPAYYGRIPIIGDLAGVRQRLGLTAAGAPRYAAIRGNRLYYAPSPDQSYTTRMSYLRKLTALSATNTSNWLLEEHPDAYLYASLVQAEPHLPEGDPRVEKWALMMDDALTKMQKDAWSQEWGDGRVRQLRDPIGG